MEDKEKDESQKIEKEKEKKKLESIDENLMKCFRELMGLSEKPTIPNYPINKEIQKHLLKEDSSDENFDDIDSSSSEEEKITTKKVVYPSGVIKITKKMETIN